MSLPERLAFLTIDNSVAGVLARVPRLSYCTIEDSGGLSWPECLGSLTTEDYGRVSWPECP